MQCFAMVDRGHDTADIVACLSGQEDLDVFELRLAGEAHGLVNASFACIVGRDGQGPRSELIIEDAQVPGRGAAAGVGPVARIVALAPQAKPLRCLGHELEQAHRPGVADGVGIPL